MSKRLSSAQSGFTIVELMVATLVFTTILLVITVGVIKFTTDYYRGLNSSTTQNLARSITDQITQAIQFAGAMPSAAVTAGFPANSGVLCIGDKEYYFHLGAEVNNATDIGLRQWQVAYNQCNTSATPGVGYYQSGDYANAKELLQPHMRLTSFGVTNIGGDDVSTYGVSIGIAYGDDDLLCAPETKPGSCAANAANLTDFTVADLTCRSKTGSQFCSIINLTSNVQSRVNFGG